MPFNIDEFQSRLPSDGAFSANFDVQILNPVNSAGDLDVPFLCKTAQIPGITTGSIEQKYFGRTINLPGTNTFEDWTVTILNDENFRIRNAMEQWAFAINSPAGNIRSQGIVKSDAEVRQYSKSGEIIRVYKFVDLFPISVAPIDLSWDNTDQIEEFQVTFKYNYWEVAGGTTGNAGGN